MTSVEIPNSVTYIGYSAFVGCDNLKIVFYNATNSKSGSSVVFDKSCTFVIGENVTNLPDKLFSSNASCTVVSHATVPPVISASTFGSNTTVYVSSAAYTDYCAADVWSDMTIRRIETPVTSIALNVDDTHIDTNGSSQLTATITPADATLPTLYWSSDNPKVASVDQNGLVHGLSDGEATITAKAIDGSNLTATCTVTVDNGPATDVTCVAVQDDVNPDDFYATFSNNATDVELHPAAGATLTVYDVTVSGNTLVLTPRDANTVARGEAVLVKTSYSTFTASPLSGSSLTPAKYGTATLLLATPSEAQTVSCQAGEAKLYRLTYYDINKKTGLGFYWGSDDGTQVKAKPGKGYLKVPTSQTAEIKGFRINLQPTHVDGIDAEVQGSDEPIYDLSGRRVENPTSGIYLQNNKKIIVK
ncbi:MAG: Ig domain-containing protein [Muribaculaceae bacterium]